jgi:flagellar secretion chaperone FliS
MMNSRAASAYRRVDLESAPKQDILGRLYERCLADISQAKQSIGVKDFVGKAKAIDHALRIVSELEAALDHAVAPELCGNLQALYRFVAERLSMVNLTLEVKGLDEATKIMSEIADSFRQVSRR